MKKRIVLAFILSVIMLLTLGVGTAFASDLDVDVDISDVNVVVVDQPDWYWLTALDEYNYYIGTMLHLSGTVTIVSFADPEPPFGWVVPPTYGEASSEAGFAITAPLGATVASDSNSEYEFDNTAPYTADASQTFEWEADITLDELGEYIVDVYGIANAEWIYKIWQWWHWVTYSGSDEDMDENILSLMSWAIPSEPILEYDGLDGWCNGGGFTAYINNLWEARHQQTVSFDSLVSRELVSGIDLTADGINITILDGTAVNYGEHWLAGAFGVKYNNGVLTFDTPYIKFSLPVVISDASTGEILACFDAVVNGVPNNVSLPVVPLE